jgi:putative colanic acid biosynthesis UDP-glucose lipid carrier transferase
VNGVRGEVVRLEDLRKRIEYDLEYIRHWSVRFDLKILFLTATREIISKNAF